jgi:hypothetical protein
MCDLNMLFLFFFKSRYLESPCIFFEAENHDFDLRVIINVLDLTLMVFLLQRLCHALNRAIKTIQQLDRI